MLLFWTGLASANEVALRAKSDAAAERLRASCDLSLFLAGDAIVTLPWSHVDEPAFLDVIAEMRAADAAIVNLETVIHTYQGYAQRDSGGSHLASPPEVAEDLAWAGVDMVAHANNHTFDYGSIAVLENLKFVEAAGMELAGSGPDLQRARAPAYFVTGNRGSATGQKIALVSMASTFVDYGQASNSHAGLQGRPGLNPLTLIKKTEYVIPRSWVVFLQETVRALGFAGDRFNNETFQIAGFNFRVGDSLDRHSGLRALPKDLEGNLAAIREAAQEADIVIASLHFHGDGSEELAWLQGYARQAMDAGADIFHNHGPHFVRGIEIHNGKPIFYGMGDFAFQIEQISRLSAEVYEEYGLSTELTAQEAITTAWGNRKGSLLQKPETFEGFATSLCLVKRRVVEMRLLPLDLHFGGDLQTRGRPGYADAALGRKIIEEVAAASEPYGVEVVYDPTENLGRVIFPLAD